MKKITFLILLILPIFSFSQWSQIGSDIDGQIANETSGNSVSLSSDGNIVAIGSPNRNSNTGFGTLPGSVRIFENLAGIWSQVGSDIVGEAISDQFGYSVSLSADGGIVAIGGPDNTGNKGHVRIFENLAGVWTQIGADIDGSVFGDSFGHTVSLSADGSVVAIDSGVLYPGSAGSKYARVYKNVSGIWTQIGSDFPCVKDGDISLNVDGNIVAVGGSPGTGVGAFYGGVRIYENVSGVWTQLGNTIVGDAASVVFGYSVSLNADGNIVAITDYLYSGVNGYSSGRLRVFENLSGVWTQIGGNIDGEATLNGGIAVDLSSDGTIVALGSTGGGGATIPGIVRIFKNELGVWTQIGVNIVGESSLDNSGHSLSLSANGSIVAIGAISNMGNPVTAGVGHVRVFTNPTLSIENNTFGSEFKVYPNPSNGVSKINLGATYSEVNLQIVDILGKVISVQNHTNTNEVILNTESYTSGMYFIKVESGTKSATIKLVVE